MALSLNTKKLIIRILLFLVYLLVGAAIFQAIELQNEKKLRDEDQFLAVKKNLTIKYNISNEDMNEFFAQLKRALELGFDLQSADYPDRYQWHFMNAFFFAGNVVTTIGYGHIVPSSFWGRLFCIFYALVGIPLTGLTLRSVGNRISEGINIAVKIFERRMYNREAERLEIKTAIIAFILLIAIVIFPAFGFHSLEEWTYFESVYFCFVTLTTIGFGDFVPVNLKKDFKDDAIPVVLEFLNLIYMVVGLAVMSGVIVSISGVIEEKTKNMVMPDPLETLKAMQMANLNSKAMRKLGYKMGPTPTNEDMRQRQRQKPPKINSPKPRGLEASCNLDRSQSADNMDFQGPTPILHLNKNSAPCYGTKTPDGSPQDSNNPKLMFNNKVVPAVSEADLEEQEERRNSRLSSSGNRSDSHDEIERELAPSNNITRRNTLTEKTGSRNELVVQAQITPLPTPRSSPAPSPVPAENDHFSPREEPSLDVEEHKISFINSYKATNGEHVPNNELPPVEVINKNAAILNGFVGQSNPLDGKRPVSKEATLEMDETAHQQINRMRGIYSSDWTHNKEPLLLD